MKEELTPDLNGRLNKVLLCLWHIKQHRQLCQESRVVLEKFSVVSQETQQEHTVLPVLPTEEVATFPFLTDVELGEGNTSGMMEGSGDVTQETKHVSQKIHCLYNEIF